MVFQRIFGRKKDDEISTMLYAQIVAHARHQNFYSTLAVPDTLDGRFDMLVLHAFLFFHRLKEERETDKKLGQAVFDVMFEDLDQVVRELGVSDIAVGKRIKKMANAFYGRIGAYDAALTTYDEEPAELEMALKRNMFPEQEVDQDVITTLAAYVSASADVLSQQAMNEFTGGHVRFAAAPAELKQAARNTQHAG